MVDRNTIFLRFAVLSNFLNEKKNAEYTETNIHTTQKGKKLRQKPVSHIYLLENGWHYDFELLCILNGVKMWKCDTLVRGKEREKSGSNKHHFVDVIIYILHACDNFFMLKIQNKA